MAAKRRWSDATVARRLSTLRGFTRWLHRAGDRRKRATIAPAALLLGMVEVEDAMSNQIMHRVGVDLTAPPVPLGAWRLGAPTLPPRARRSWATVGAASPA